MKATVRQFLEYVNNAGIEFVIDEDISDSEGGVEAYRVPDGYACRVDGQFVETAIEVFTEDCDDVFEPNTIRVVTDVENEIYTSYPVTQALEFEVFKKVI